MKNKQSKNKRNKQPHGTNEWADFNVNIQIGCENACLYCYAAERITNTKRIRTRAEWTNPTINPDKVNKRYALRKKQDGSPKRAMFPTSHDITEANQAECIVVAKKLLESGNRLLLVSKPRLGVVKTLCEVLDMYKANIVFRFSIGSSDDRILKFWEPGAPSYAERVEALQWAHGHGFQTSVSCEPMLDNNVEKVVNDVRVFTTDSIWIGKPNRLKICLRRNCTKAEYPEAIRKADELTIMHSEERIRSLYEVYRDDQLIRWKDSLKAVLGIERPETTGMDI